MASEAPHDCAVCCAGLPPPGERAALGCGRVAGAPRGHGDQICPGCLARSKGLCPLCRAPFGAAGPAVRAAALRHCLREARARLQATRAALEERGWWGGGGPAPGADVAPALRWEGGRWGLAAADTDGGAARFQELADAFARQSAEVRVREGALCPPAGMPPAGMPAGAGAAGAGGGAGGAGAGAAPPPGGGFLGAFVRFLAVGGREAENNLAGEVVRGGLRLGAGFLAREFLAQRAEAPAEEALPPGGPGWWR